MSDATTEAEADRWAIRNIARTDRDAAVSAAARARLGVGEWLGRAIRAYIAAERELGADILVGNVVVDMPKGSFPLATHIRNAVAHGDVDSVPTLETIGRAVEIAKAIADISGQKPAPRILAAAKRGLLHHMGEAHADRKREVPTLPPVSDAS